MHDRQAENAEVKKLSVQVGGHCERVQHPYQAWQSKHKQHEEDSHM